jgi:FixJ family two-component response regulator
MLPRSSTVFLIAGDPAARRAMIARLKTMPWTFETCPSVEALLDRQPTGLACVLLDISQPATDLETLGQVRQAAQLPVVATSAKADVPLAVRAMKLGAHDFLDASCADTALAHALQEAFQWHEEHQRQIRRIHGIRRRLAQLSAGQREVLDLVVAGKTNPQIAEELDLTVRAVEVRRSKMMETMKAKSLAQLVRLVITAETRLER